MAAKTICQEKEIVEKGRKRQRKDYICNLPDEIIENILLRVRSEDVLCIMSVCKSWSSRLREDFLISHYRLSDSHQETEVILFTTVAKPTLYSDKYQYDNFSLNPLDLSSPPADDEIQFHDQPKTLVLQSSCRGMLLFQDRYAPRILYFSNPTLDLCMAIPITPTYCSQWTLIHDQLNNVFKVVGFYYNSMDVFTDSNKWQSYSNVIGSNYYDGKVLSQFFCLGEELHWLGIDLENSSEKICYYIFSMHISTETFTKTRVPERITQPFKNGVDSSIRKGMHLLTDLNGYLCLTIISDDQLRVLVLLDKTESRWLRTHIIHLPTLYNHPDLRLGSFIHDDICIIGLKSDNILDIFKILIHQDDQVYYYDLKTDELTPIAHLSKDKKLCRTYMFHSNRFTVFW